MQTVSGAGRRRWCKRLGVVVGVVLVGYWAATFANVDNGLLNLIFTVAIVLMVPLSAWAALSAPRDLRRFFMLAVSALFFQVVGAVLWYIAYFGKAGAAPWHLGVWTPFECLALLLALAAVWIGLRAIVRPRDALLDYSILIAAAASFGFLIINLHGPVGVEWVVGAVVRPGLCLLIVVLVVSAALGRWQTLPLAVGLVGICLMFDAAGVLLVSYYISQGTYTSDRWTDLLWFTAVAAACVACLVLIAGVDRPIRLSRSPLPGVSPGPVLAVTTVAWAVAGAVAVRGAIVHGATLFAGLAAVAWIGVAGLLRMVAALAETRSAYRRLDEAHFSLEQAREHAEQLVAERDEVIARLEQRNVELTAIQTMLGPLLDIADERTNGLLRSNLEDTADDLWQWLAPRRAGEETP